MASYTKFHVATEEQLNRIRNLLGEMGFSAPAVFSAYDKEGNTLQIVVPEKSPEPESLEARKAAVMKAITERRDLPYYAHYGNASGSIYIQHYLNGRWVYSTVDFYEVIKAVARRVVQKGSQVL